MTKRILAAAAVLACTVLPLAAYAQTSGVAAGATTGAVGGAIVGGPIGAVVGGVGGAIIGGLSDEQRPRFREYAVQQRRPSYQYQEEVRSRGRAAVEWGSILRGACRVRRPRLPLHNRQ